MMICAALLASASLSACDKFGGSEPAPQPTKTAAGKPAPKKNTNPPVEEAMMRIPPQMRESYQAAFACEVKRNKAKEGAKAINVTAEYVNGLVARLKADASLAKC